MSKKEYLQFSEFKWPKGLSYTFKCLRVTVPSAVQMSADFLGSSLLRWLERTLSNFV